jgi:hypothetical protein
VCDPPMLGALERGLAALAAVAAARPPAP